MKFLVDAQLPVKLCEILRQPKKLLLITTGNIRNRRLFDLIRANAQTIHNLFNSCSYVEMANDSIIGHER